MNEPFDGKVNPRLIYKKFNNCVFYYVADMKGQLAKIEPCILYYSDNLLFIKSFNENWELGKWAHRFNWENLFFNYDEAKKASKEINDRILSFKYKPYLSYKILEEHFDELRNIEKLIDKLLLGFDNYDGIDFCDVGAGGIQVRIHHRSISNYTYGQQKTIFYDFSNIGKIPYEVAEEFVRIDTPELILEEKEFIAFGEKYGWD